MTGNQFRERLLVVGAAAASGVLGGVEVGDLLQGGVGRRGDDGGVIVVLRPSANEGRAILLGIWAMVRRGEERRRREEAVGLAEGS